MLGRLFRLIWRLLKPVRVAVRIGFYIWLVTFPLYGLHLIQGIIDGSIMAYMEDSYDLQGYNAFLSNMRSMRMFQSVELPGAPLIDEVGMEPFYVPLIRNPAEWWMRLGMARYGFIYSSQLDPFEMVEQLANPNGLYRIQKEKAKEKEKEKEKEEQEETGPWHHWVYASPSYIIGPGGLYNEWDIAFNELVQHHYATPAAHNATFRAIGCGRSSLCQFWRLDGPALIHFTTERPRTADAEDAGESFNLAMLRDGYANKDAYPDWPGFDRVYAHVVGLPLKETDHEVLTIQPGIFPSHFEQMRAITSDDRLWEEYPRLTPAWQSFLRMVDTCEELEKSWPQTYGRLVASSRYVTNLIGLDDGHVLAEFVPYTIGLTIGLVLTSIPIVFYSRFVDPGFFEMDTLSDDIHRALQYAEARVDPPQYDKIFADAIDKVLKSAAAAAAASAAPATSRPSPGA